MKKRIKTLKQKAKKEQMKNRANRTVVNPNNPSDVATHFIWQDVHRKRMMKKRSAMDRSLAATYAFVSELSYQTQKGKSNETRLLLMDYLDKDLLCHGQIFDYRRDEDGEVWLLLKNILLMSEFTNGYQGWLDAGYNLKNLFEVMQNEKPIDTIHGGLMRALYQSETTPLKLNHIWIKESDFRAFVLPSSKEDEMYLYPGSSFYFIATPYQYRGMVGEIAMGDKFGLKNIKVIPRLEQLDKYKKNDRFVIVTNNTVTAEQQRKGHDRFIGYFTNTGHWMSNYAGINAEHIFCHSSVKSKLDKTKFINGLTDFVIEMFYLHNPVIKQKLIAKGIARIDETHSWEQAVENGMRTFLKEQTAEEQEQELVSSAPSLDDLFPELEV